MARIRRRPISQRRPSVERDSRAKLRRRLGLPPDVDHQRLSDPDYLRDVIEPFRRSIGWVPVGPGWAFGTVPTTRHEETE